MHESNGKDVSKYTWYHDALPKVTEREEAMKKKVSYYGKIGATRKTDVSNKKRHLIIGDDGHAAMTMCNKAVHLHIEKSSITPYISGILHKCKSDDHSPVCKTCETRIKKAIARSMKSAYDLMEILTDQLLDCLSVDITCQDSVTDDIVDLACCDGDTVISNMIYDHHVVEVIEHAEKELGLPSYQNSGRCTVKVGKKIDTEIVKK